MTKEEIQAQINGYKLLLSQTDYKALKHADGAMSEEEYRGTKEKRAEYRDAINNLEMQLEALPVEEPFER